MFHCDKDVFFPQTFIEYDSLEPMGLWESHKLSVMISYRSVKNPNSEP